MKRLIMVGFFLLSIVNPAHALIMNTGVNGLTSYVELMERTDLGRFNLDKDYNINSFEVWIDKTDDKNKTANAKQSSEFLLLGIYSGDGPIMDYKQNKILEEMIEVPQSYSGYTGLYNLDLDLSSGDYWMRVGDNGNRLFDMALGKAENPLFDMTMRDYYYPIPTERGPQYAFRIDGEEIPLTHNPEPNTILLMMSGLLGAIRVKGKII